MIMHRTRFFRLSIYLAVILQNFIIPASVFTADSDTSDWRFTSLQNRLIQDGFHPDRVQALYQAPQVSFETRAVSSFFVHSEAKLNYDQFTNQWSINKAQQYMKKHHALLEKTEQAYGVDKKIITAIILVETALGDSLGKSPIFNTLSSLSSFSDPEVRKSFWKSFDKKDEISKKDFVGKALSKSEWAYKELKALLKYTEREKIDPTTIRGSYAGALGIAQFMPTTLLAYAKDGNQDGRVDLFTHADAMASIASFLKRFGWRPGIDTEKAKKIIFRYNHSPYYVNTIIKISNLLAG